MTDDNKIMVEALHRLINQIENCEVRVNYLEQNNEITEVHYMGQKHPHIIGRTLTINYDIIQKKQKKTPLEIYNELWANAKKRALGISNNEDGANRYATQEAVKNTRKVWGMQYE